MVLITKFCSLLLIPQHVSLKATIILSTLYKIPQDKLKIKQISAGYKGQIPYCVKLAHMRRCFLSISISIFNHHCLGQETILVIQILGTSTTASFASVK